jgi:hypothetical protein
MEWMEQLDFAYRGSKFIRRHSELAVGALTFLFFVLFGGLAVIRHWEVSKPGPGPGPEPQREAVHRQLTANAPGDQIWDAVISRDGKYLAYRDKAWKMYLLQIDGGELRLLPSSDFTPEDWFPDGNHLLVSGRSQHSGLWKISIEDGTSRKLLDRIGQFAAVSPEGSHIAYLKDMPENEIWLMGASGEDPHRIAEFDGQDSIHALAWSPSGRRLVYIRDRSEFQKGEVVIETCDLHGGDRTLVLSEPRLVAPPNGISDAYWLSDGRIIYRLPDPLSYADSGIWGIATDPESGRPVAPPVRLTNGALQPENFHASTDGKRLTYASSRHRSDVYLGSLQPARRRSLTGRMTPKAPAAKRLRIVPLFHVEPRVFASKYTHRRTQSYL